MPQTVQITIQTPEHETLLPITRYVEDAVSEMDLFNGLIHVFVLHTTCGLTINENADPAVIHDLLHRLNDIAPWRHPADRHSEGNSAAHLKSSLLGSSLTIPVSNGRLMLGTWQAIFFGEFDGPRTRKVFLTAVPV